MVIPARIGPKFFYPVDSTPAVCLTHSLPPDQDAHLLLLGCGDARNVLFTVYADLSTARKRKLDFTCCDIEPEIIARNIILFTLLIDDKQNVNLQKIWNIYYHVRVDQDSLDLLQKQASKLKSLAATPDSWKEGQYGKVLRFADSYTLTEVTKLWDFYSRTPSDGSAYDDQQSLLHQGYEKVTQIRSQLVGDKSMLGTLRSTAPVSAAAHKDMSESYLRYWQYGVADPSQEASDPGKKLNPMFGTPNMILTLHYGTDPVLDFHLATGYAPLSSNSPLKPQTRKNGSSNNVCYRAALVAFSAYAKAFRGAISRLTIRSVASDALAFCHTLQHLNDTGDSKARWYQNPRTYVPLDLDASEFYHAGNNPAPRSFDGIDTSNLVDQLGCLNLLAAAGPLLNPKPTSTLSTELLVHCEEERGHFFEDLPGDLPTVALLFNLTPIQYWTGTTAALLWDQRQPDMIPQGLKVEGLSQSRYILQWKSTRHTTQGAHLRKEQTIPLRFDPVDLTLLLNQMYLRTVKHETSPGLAISRQEPARRPYGVYTRSSLVAILKLIHKSDLVDWKIFISELCRLITRDHSINSTASYTSPQELFVYMHLCGLPLPSDYELEPYRLGEGMSCPLQHWGNIPSTLCITVVVPQECLDEAISAKGHPITHVVLNGPGTNGDLVFSDIQIGFGKLDVSGAKNSESCTLSVQPDGEPWNSDAPMIVSVILPSSIIHQDRDMSTRVTFGLKPSTVPSQSFVGKLGAEFGICQSSLKDTNVFITRYRPNMTGYQSICGNPVSLCAQAEEPTPCQSTDSKTHARFHVSLDKNLRAESITVHVDIDAGPLQDSLRSGVAVSVSQSSPYGVSIRFDHGVFVKRVQFPFPVTMAGSKTKIVREESYVEFMALVAPRSELSIRPDNLYGTGLYQQRPKVFNPHYISLDHLPILDTENPAALEWLRTHLSDMWSATERAFREGHVDTDLRANFKDTLFNLFLKFAGVKSTKHQGPFGLNDFEKGGLFALILPANLRLDLSNQTVVLDAAIFPITSSSLPKMESLLSTVSSVSLMVLDINERESLLWKHALPAMVERCRTWTHKPSCGYSQAGKMPISLEVGQRNICLCGNGIFPANFWSKNEGELGRLWRRVSRRAIRTAISPCFSVPFVEKQDAVPLPQPGPSSAVSIDDLSTKLADLDIRRRSCALCGKKATEAGNLWKCGRCKAVEYCSRECQREHWTRGHKRLCPLLRHSERSE